MRRPLGVVYSHSCICSGISSSDGTPTRRVTSLVVVTHGRPLSLPRGGYNNACFKRKRR